VSGGFDGEDPALVHQRFAAALDGALDQTGASRSPRTTPPARARGIRASTVGLAIL
jgi:hypothetical protein